MSHLKFTFKNGNKKEGGKTMILWQAKLTEEETARLTDQDCDQMTDDLEIYFEQLKTDHLKEGKD